jgi:hypothetical protein
VISTTDSWPQGRPVFWQTAAVVLLGLLLRRRWRRTAGPFDPVLIAAMAGNVMFYVGWFFIGLAVEFRYSYTVIITCLLTVAVLLIQGAAARRQSQTAAEAGPAIDPAAPQG